MYISRILTNKSALDFLVMFSTNLIKKGFGFVREVILAAMFGSSLIFAQFLLLKIVADLLFQLTQGSALQANIMPRFSRLYEKGEEVSLHNIIGFSKKGMIQLFIISQLIQFILILYINPENFLLFLLISFFLSVVISFTFFSSIFLNLIQAKGNFKKHSYATTSDMFISTLFLYPLISVFGVLGVVISRIMGLLSLFFFYLKDQLYELKGNKVKFGLEDFNFHIMIIGNLANIILILSRFVAGTDGDNTITYFNYSIVLLNILFTAVILNLNTLLLKRLTIHKDLRSIFYCLLIAVLSGLGMVKVFDLYGLDIIRLIFERGVFTSEDTFKTYIYIKSLSLSFVLIFIASVLFQPYLSLKNTVIKQDSRIMAFIFILSSIILFVIFTFINTSAQDNSLLMIYILSSLSVVLSIYSFYKYLYFTKSKC